MVQTASDSQKSLCINEWIQVFERTTFGYILMLLDTFDLLIINFLLYCLDDDCYGLIGFLGCEFCFAVMPALAGAVLLSRLGETGYV